MNKFTMKSTAPYSLNYLIYIQNAFLNRQQKNAKFPAIDISHWGLLEERVFCDSFKEVWADMTRRIANNFLVDHNGIFDREPQLFQALFRSDEQGRAGFEESRKSFDAWFSSLAGQITIEHAADYIVHYNIDLYNKVSALIDHNGTRHELLISFIYDECVLGDSDGESWHAIISLQDIYFKRQKEELVSNIVSRWNTNKR